MNIIKKTNPIILSTFAITLLMGASSSVLGMEDDGKPYVTIVLKPKGATATSQDDKADDKKQVLTISGEGVSKTVDKATEDVSKAVDKATQVVKKAVDKVVETGKEVKVEVAVQKKEPASEQKVFRRMKPNQFVTMKKVRNAVAHTAKGIEVVTDKSRYGYQLLGNPVSPNMKTRAFRVSYVVDVEEGGLQISLIKGAHGGQEKILGDDVKGQKRLSHPYWKASGKRIEGFLEIASQDFPKYGIVPNGRTENQLAVLVNNVRDGQDEPEGGISKFTFLELFWELIQEDK